MCYELITNELNKIFQIITIHCWIFRTIASTFNESKYNFPAENTEKSIHIIYILYWQLFFSSSNWPLPSYS